MYLEIRKNVFYLKESFWNKETKKTETRKPRILGYSASEAQTKLEELLDPASPLLKQFPIMVERNNFELTIKGLSKLLEVVGEDCKQGKDIKKLLEKTKADSKKYDDKSLLKEPPKSRFKESVIEVISEDNSKNNDDESEDNEEDEEENEDE